jgi:tellurite resistance protein TerC
MMRTFVPMNPNQILILTFVVVILLLLILDLRSLFKHDDHVKNPKNALVWSIVWISTAMLFSLFVLFEKGFEKFSQFQSAYWIEQSLSVDNLFVFLMVFKFFKIDGIAQRKVLLWGILGAIVLRAVFIFSGTWLIKLTYLPPFWEFVNPPDMEGGSGFTQINLILTVFGFLLITGGIQALKSKEEDVDQDFSKSISARFVKRTFKVLVNYESNKFWIRRNGKLFFTKLFMVLFIIETTDLLFAIDSVPAIFSIAPNDPFILYSSNIFAIFSLRALFFLLSDSLNKFDKLRYGISVILIFIGLKIILAPIYEINTLLSLMIILFSLLISILISLRTHQKSAN